MASMTAASMTAEQALIGDDNDKHHGSDAMMVTSFTSLQEEATGFTLFQTSVTAFKSVVGPAVLYNPHIFAVGGYAFGAISLVSAFLLWSVGVYGLMLINLEHGCGKSYDDLAVMALGRFGKVGVSIAIVLQQLGIVTSYFVFVYNSIVNEFPDVAGPRNAFLLIFTMGLLEIPLCILRSLERVRPSIMFATALCSLALAFMIGEIFVDLVEQGGPVNSTNPYGPIKAFNPSWAQGVGSAVFAFEGSAALALPVHNAVRPDLQAAGAKTYVGTVAGIVVMYVVYGAAGYFLYGDDTQASIINNLDFASPFIGYANQVVRWCFIIMVFLTFPFQMFPASTILSDTCLGGRGKNVLVARLSRAALTMILALLGFALKDKLEKITGLIGALLGIPLSFMFPAAIHWSLVEQTLVSRARHTFLLVFGAVMMVFCAYTTIKNWND